MARQRSEALALVTDDFKKNVQPAIRFADIRLAFAGENKNIIALDQVTFMSELFDLDHLASD